jgi:RNA polymerase sigma factor (sigma-70 family)
MASGGRLTVDVSVTLASFEGLIFRTSQMYAAQVKKDPDDLAQELRIKTWKALGRYSPARSKMPVERYVFMVITNKIKDYKRDAARAAQRPTVLYIEDMRQANPGQGDERPTQERFDGLFNHIERDVVYSGVDNRYQLPPTVTEPERKVLMLLVAGCTRPEIVALLGVRRSSVDGAVRALREKLEPLRS